MKNFRMAAIIAVFALGVIPLFAQPPAQGQGQNQGQRKRMTEEDVKNRVENLASTLKMTDEQKGKIMKYELDAYKKRGVEMQKNQDDREAMRSYMQSERKERDKIYEDVLDDAQFAKYKEIEEQRRQEMQERREQNPDQQGERPQRGRG